jgi:alanyl aminopeptidase
VRARAWLRLAAAVLVGFTVSVHGPLAAAADVAAAAEPAVPELRLPQGARPVGYDVTLTVVPGEPWAAGEISIDVELDRPHSLVWLNADGIDVSEASVDASASVAPAGDSTTKVRVAANREQFLGLAFEPALTAGRHRLRLAYRAAQDRKSSRGIFTLEDGGTWYSMTQFEPISARKAFPCFDEPHFKASWRIALRIPRDMAAVSNTPIVAQEDVADGRKLVRFAPTDPLPSYLVAFAVGHWDTESAGTLGRRPTPMRLFAPRGQRAALAFGVRTFPALFDLEERWFGIAHPFSKLDHVAIPLGVRFAMENAGMITYGGPILLQPGSATPAFRHTLVSIAAHEIAHQWFGDLVTPAWWDDIWLNEAFATWLAEKTVDAWQPGYERGAQRVHARADAIEEDRLASARRIREPIRERGDIFNAFDSITYQKGATVIGMFEAWVGEEPFRRGVREYLEHHRYGNATVDDFLGALDAATGRPVRSAFSTFLDQNGVPEVGVALECSRGRARLPLTQRRHAAQGDEVAAQQWQIPVCARYGDGHASRTACTLLTEPKGELDVGAGCPAFVVANAGGRGYYLPAYDADLLARLARHRDALTAAEYASVLYDLRALVRAGSVTGSQALEWASAAARSPDRHVMVAAIALASFVRDELVSDDGRTRFSAFVRREFAPRARALGFAPRRGESDDDQLLRRSLLAFAAPEDPALAAEARRLAHKWRGDRSAVDPGLVDTVLLIAARTGDATLFDEMLAEVHRTPNRLDRRNLTIALYAFGDSALAQRGLGMLLDPQVDIRDAMTALGMSMRRAPPSPVPHAFIAEHFDALAARVDADAPGGWPGYAAELCSEADRDAVAAFWKSRVASYAGAERNLAEALESIASCSRLRARERANVGAFLARYGTAALSR